MRFTRTLLVALGMVAAQGCKSDSSHQAAGRVVEKSRELAEARADFQVRREARFDTLRAEREVIATQPLLISTMAQAFPLTEAGREDVNEKLQVLQMRLDETANLVERLHRVSAADFKARDDAAGDAMTRLEDARRAAWQALQNAPRTDRSS